MTNASPPIPPISGSPPQTIPYPTPADVKAEPLAPLWADAFALVPDARVQRYINSAAVAFGSCEVLQHTQRNEAVLYGAAHLLALALISQGIITDAGGGGGLNGPWSSVKLDGAASVGFAVKQWEADWLNDWLKQKTPFSTDLHRVLGTFPPTMYVIGSQVGLEEFQPLAPYFYNGWEG